MKRIIILAAAALLAAALPAARALAGSTLVTGDVPEGFWNARLWLTSQAFGLEEDCPVRVLFQDPPFRSATMNTGGTATSRLASREMHGSDLFLVIETTLGTTLIERVTLQLRWHRAEGIVSVESIGLEGQDGADRQTLRYDAAVSDDEQYDLYTDTLVSLYRSFFDGTMIRQRAGAPGG